MALLDEQRRLIAESERFEVTISALPTQAMSVYNVPTGIKQADVRALGKALAQLTTVWTSADHRSFRLLFARIPVPPGSHAGAGVRAVRVVFAHELTQTRQVIKNELHIFVVTLLIGALLSGLLGVWIARRIVAGPRGLAAAANRISARPMSERLSVEQTPTLRDIR